MTAFVSELMDPRLPVPEGLQDGHGRAAGQRFDVHRNNVVHALRAALRLGFPTVARLLGRDAMDQAATTFLRAHPPTDPHLMYYGGAFPKFLGSVKSLTNIPYLPDAAELDLAVRRAYHAGDAVGVTANYLSSIPPETLLQASVTLAPAVQVIRSEGPVLDIWNDVQSPKSAAQDVLITRPEFDPVVQVLEPGGATWIQALDQGVSIGDAMDMAAAECKKFDMGPPLTRLLSGRAIVSLKPSD